MDFVVGVGGIYDEMYVIGVQFCGFMNDFDYVFLYLGGVLVIVIDQVVYGDGVVELVNGLQVGEVELVLEVMVIEMVDE